MTRDEFLHAWSLVPVDAEHAPAVRERMARDIDALLAAEYRRGMERAAEICGEVENLHEDFADGAIECFDRIHESIREEARRG